MADDKDDKNGAVAPEMLKSKEGAEGEAAAPDSAEPGKEAENGKIDAKTSKRRAVYKPGHRATIIGVVVVALILIVNGGIIYFIIKKQATTVKQLTQGQVTINQGVLDKLGVNRSSVGDDGVELTINPNTKFGGTVQVAKDFSIGGKLSLNGDFTAPSGAFAKLQGGDTSLTKLNVNADSSFSNVAIRSELNVTGTTRLQGPTTISSLLTANTINVAGNLSIGGVLTANNFHTGTFTVDSILYLGGHIVTQGTSPSIVAGNALGQNGTVAVGGSDAAGTVSVAIGVGATSGTIGTVTFRVPYSSTPRVVITPIGNTFGGAYINRNARGFTIVTSSPVPPGGYAFDYIVIQ